MEDAGPIQMLDDYEKSDSWIYLFAFFFQVFDESHNLFGDGRGQVFGYHFMLAGLIVDLGQDITKGFLARKSVDEKWKLDLLCHTFKFKVDAGPELRQKKKKRHSWFTMDVRCAAWEPITSRSDTVRWIREKHNMNKFQNKNDDAPDERKSNREERSNKRERRKISFPGSSCTRTLESITKRRKTNKNARCSHGHISRQSEITNNSFFSFSLNPTAK